jgi:hypothetical protein
MGITYGDWCDADYSSSLDVCLCVGNGKLAYVYGKASSRVEHPSASISGNYRKVKWLDWLGKWLLVKDSGLEVMTKADDLSSIASVNTSTLPTATISDVCVWNNTVVVVGLGMVAYTTDLSTWNVVSSSAWSGVSDLRSVTVGEVTAGAGVPRVVVCGVGGFWSVAWASIATGSSWTYTSLSGNWVGVAYGLDTFIAINDVRSDTSRHAYSVDGIKWTLHMESITYSSNGIGTGFMNAFGRIYYFPQISAFLILADFSQQHNVKWYLCSDGINFYPLAAEGLNQIAGVCYNAAAGKFIGVSRTYRAGVDPFFPIVNFTQCNTVSNTTLGAQAVAIASRVRTYPTTSMMHTIGSTNNAFFYCADGKNWAQCTINGSIPTYTDRYIYDTAYSPDLGLWIGCSGIVTGKSYTVLIKSTDGINWVDDTANFASYAFAMVIGNMHGVVYSTVSKKFVLSLWNVNYYTSTDGVTWTGLNGYPQEYLNWVYEPTLDKIVGVFGYSTKCFVITLNGSAAATYSYGFTTPFTTAPKDIVFFNGFFYVLDAGGLNIYRSADGTSWALAFTVSPAGANSLAVSTYYNMLIVMTPSSFYYSQDGINVTSQYAINGVSFSGYLGWNSYWNKFYAVYAYVSGQFSATRDIYSNLFISNDVVSPQWFASPSGVNYDQLDDRIQCALTTGTTTFTSMDSYSRNRLTYSRVNSTLYAYSASVGSGRPVYTLNTGATFTQCNGSWVSDSAFAIYDTDNGMVAGGFNGTVRGLYYANSTISAYPTTTATGIVLTAAPQCYSASQQLLCLVDSTGMLRYMRYANEADLSGYIQLPALPTWITIASGNSSSQVVVGVYASGVIAVNLQTAAIQQTSLSVTFTRVEYVPRLRMFVAVGTNCTGYSVDGVAWTTSASTTTWTDMKFIPELNTIVACGTNVFGYSIDGIVWKSITTPTNAWVAVEYDVKRCVFILLGSTAPKIMVSSPVLQTPANTWCPPLGYFEGDKLFIGRSGMHPSDKVLTHTLETDLDVALNPNGAGSTYLMGGYKSTITAAGGTGLSTFALGSASLKINIVNSTPQGATPRGLGIRGEIVKASPDQITRYRFNNSSLNDGTTDMVTREGGNAGRYIVVNKLGNICLGGVAATSITMQTANESLLVVPKSGNLLLDKVTTNSLTVNNTTVSDTSARLKAPMTTASTDLLVMADSGTTFFMNKTFGMAYSPTLDLVLVIGIITVNGTDRAGISLSYDRGSTWKYTAFSHLGLSYTIPSILSTQYTVPLLEWSTQHNAFIHLCGLNAFMYSTDGTNWVQSTMSPAVSSSSLWFDTNSSLWRVNGSTGYATFSASDPSVVTTTTTTTPLIQRFWSAELGAYIGHNSTTTLSSASVLTAATWSTVFTYADPIARIAVGTSGKLYVVTYNATSSKTTIYYKPTTAAVAGTAMYVGTSDGFAAIQYLPDLQALITIDSTCIRTCTDGSSFSSVYAHSTDVSNYQPQSNLGSVLVYAKDRVVGRFSGSGHVCISAGAILPTKSSLSAMGDVYRQRMLGDGMRMSYAFSYTRIFSSSSAASNTYACCYNSAASNKSMTYVFAGDGFVSYNANPRMSVQNTALTGSWRFITSIAGMLVMAAPAEGLIATTTTNGDASAWATYSPGWTSLKGIESNGNLVVGVDSTTQSIYTTTTPNVQASWQTQAVSLSVSTGTIPAFTGWNAVKWVNNMWFLLGKNVIAYTTNSTASGGWTLLRNQGDWLSVAYGMGTYVFTGVWIVAKATQLPKLLVKPMTRTYSSVVYCRALEKFYAVVSDRAANNYTVALSSTANGHDWVHNMPVGFESTKAYGKRFLTNIHWFEQALQLVVPWRTTNPTGKYSVGIASPVLIANNESTVKALPSTINVRSNRIEIGNTTNAATGTALLNLFTDSAAKPATSTWTVTSDARVKEDIQLMDTVVSQEIIKTIPLRKYTWREEVAQQASIPTQSRTKLGWIAQEVEPIIPSAIQTSGEGVPIYGVDNCKMLDSDQIIAHMWGAIQQLSKKIKEKEDAISSE